MAETIKYNNYKNSDIKILLKRKTQTAGRYLLSSGSSEVAIYVNAVSDKDGNVYVLDAATNEVHKYDKYGIFISTTATGLTNTSNIYMSRNVFFIGQAGAVDRVNLFDIDFNLINAFAGNFDNPQDMVKDSLDNLLVACFDEHVVKVRNHGEHRVDANNITNEPEGVACDTDGFTYVCDNDSGVVANTRIRKFGTDGVEVGGNWPIIPNYSAVDITTDSDNNIYVATEQYIKKYTSAGVFVSNVVVLESTEENLKVDINDNYLITVENVISTSSLSIRVYDTTTFNRAQWYNLGVNPLFDIAISNSDYIFYTDNGNITKRHAVNDVARPANIFSGEEYAVGITVSPPGGNEGSEIVYVTTTDDTVRKYRSFGDDYIYGGFAFQFEWDGSDGLAFVEPNSIAWNPKTDDINVADLTNDDVQFFSYGLDYTTASFGTQGSGDGQFEEPTGVAVDSEGFVFVSERSTNTRVQKFTSAFVYLSQLAVSGGVRDIAINEDDKLFIGVFNTNQMLIHEKAENDTDFGDYYSTFFTKDTILSVDIVQGDVFTTENLDRLYTGNNTSFYVYGVSPAFVTTHEQSWYDITRFADLSSPLDINISSDEANFSIGKFQFGNVDISLSNDLNTFDIEYNPDSIFFDEKYRTCRNGSLIKIEIDGDCLFTGIIDGKNISTDQNTIKFNIASILRKLEAMLLSDLNLTNGDKISEIIEKIVGDYTMDGYLEYNAGDIDIFYDAVIDDVSELPDNGMEAMIFLSKCGLFGFGIYDGVKFYTYSFANHLQDRTLDYIITQNDLLGSPEFNAGEQRMFTKIEYTEEYNPDSRVRWIYPEVRTVTIEGASITTGATRQTIVNNYEAITAFPTKEFTIEIPYFMPSDKKLFSKQFGFNIFDDSRSLDFNEPALELDNAILPSKETTMLGNRVLYRILGINYKIGSEFAIELKIKEMIDVEVAP